MKDNANVNPVWDSLLGYNTQSGMIRVMAAVLAFAAVGGVLASILI